MQQPRRLITLKTFEFSKISVGKLEPPDYLPTGPLIVKLAQKKNKLKVLEYTHRTTCPQKTFELLRGASEWRGKSRLELAAEFSS